MFLETSRGVAYSYDGKGDPWATSGHQRVWVECFAIRESSLFLTGIVFWASLKKELYCEWEDVATQLSLGLTYNNVSEMRSRHDLGVKRDGKRDTFHHYLDHLLAAAVHDWEVVTRGCVVKTCPCPHCPECQGFVSIFDKDRMSHLVAIANRSYFYDRVDESIFNNFRVAYLSTEAKKKKQKS